MELGAGGGGRAVFSFWFLGFTGEMMLEPVSL